ncbi:MAG: HypC/HybG/HupF family hydrogenase formation chaperone [Candidatus Sericytochromatia bacterium]
MCLAIPGEILKILDETALLRPALVQFGGIRKQISLAYVPEAQPGDYVLVHVGFAIATLQPQEALDRLAALDQLVLEEELTQGERPMAQGEQKGEQI